MLFTYTDFKKAVYWLETLMGAFFTILAFAMFRVPQTANVVLTHFLPGLVLLAVGFACILFGALSFFLREDPDIWR